MWECFEIAVNLFQVVIAIQTITEYLGKKSNELKGNIYKFFLQ